MAITINLYYSGKNGSARKFAEEMESSGIADAIRREEGNLRYDYYLSLEDGETLLLIDSWKNQNAIDKHHASAMMEQIMALRDQGATVIFSTHNMSSVEEVCDHITLINKSHNILSGRVDDIRRRYGNNIFELYYRGDEAALREALAPLCEVLGAADEPTADYSSLKLHVDDDARVREVIRRANEAVELRSFTEIIPSMNDIFIRAVNGTL